MYQSTPGPRLDPGAPCLGTLLGVPPRWLAAVASQVLRCPPWLCIPPPVATSALSTHWKPPSLTLPGGVSGVPPKTGVWAAHWGHWDHRAEQKLGGMGTWVHRVLRALGLGWAGLRCAAHCTVPVHYVL